MTRRNFKQTEADKRGHKIRVKKLREQNPEFFPEIGSVGGNKSTTQYTSESGRLAAQKRWQKYRQEQLNKEKGIE
jgi:general stress protein YciG